MRLRLSVFVVSVSLLWSASGQAQEIKNPAEVLPDTTLGYVELRQPGALAKEIAGLFEGSVLANPPDSMAKLQDKYGQVSLGRGGPDVGIFGVFTSPELVNEISRLKGAAVAVTGIDKEDKEMPEFVAFVMPGDSNIPGFMFRMVLAAPMGGYASFDGKTRTEGRTRFEPIGECEGVRLYRPVERRVTYNVGPDGRTTEAGKPTVKQVGPALARLSGTILIGTPDRVKDVIRRAKGVVKTEATLAGLPAFQDARKQLGERPGFFGYGNPAAVVDIVESFVPERERPIFASIKNLVNPKAVRAVANSLTLENGTLSYRHLVRLDPKEKSPVFEILPAAPFKPEILHFAPQDALLVAVVSNADGEKRWEKVLALADAAAKEVAGNVPPPSRVVLGFEGFLGVKIGKDLLGKIDAVAIAVPGPERLKELTKGRQPMPPVIAIVHTTDEEAATRIAKDVIPQIVGSASFQFGIKPAEKEVGGQTVYTLALGQGAPSLCYGRQGATVVIGVHDTLVAEALAGGAKKQGYLAGPKGTAVLSRAGEPIILVAGKPLTIAALAMQIHHVEHRAAPGAPAPPPKVVQPEDKMLAGLMQLAKSEEPLVISLTRKPDSILLEATYTGLKELAPKATDFLVETYYQSEAQRQPFRAAPAGITTPPKP